MLHALSDHLVELILDPVLREVHIRVRLTTE